mmetsp:Transcript_11680/g.21131  ORF Transcript_11680/g.21131 Transcript_11680/m.21131 type:complete len:344 (-) Transcript_11680:550-1581(-)
MVNLLDCLFFDGGQKHAEAHGQCCWVRDPGILACKEQHLVGPLDACFELLAHAVLEAFGGEVLRHLCARRRAGVEIDPGGREEQDGVRRLRRDLVVVAHHEVPFARDHHLRGQLRQRLPHRAQALLGGSEPELLLQCRRLPQLLQPPTQVARILLGGHPRQWDGLAVAVVLDLAVPRDDAHHVEPELGGQVGAGVDLRARLQVQQLLDGDAELLVPEDLAAVGQTKALLRLFPFEVLPANPVVEVIVRFLFPSDPDQHVLQVFSGDDDLGRLVRGQALFLVDLQEFQLVDHLHVRQPFETEALLVCLLFVLIVPGRRLDLLVGPCIATHETEQQGRQPDLVVD